MNLLELGKHKKPSGHRRIPGIGGIQPNIPLTVRKNMESEILQELILIRWLLVAILVVTAIPATLMVLSRLFGFRLKFQSRADSFSHICKETFEDGNYVELEQYCITEIGKRPNSASAHYWLARAYLAENNFSKAREQFLKTAELEPSWLKESIQPHLDTMPIDS